MTIYEAGHPIPDANGIRATEHALRLADALGAQDRMIFLVSGGGSALFEALPEGVSLEELMALTQKLLACGASITEINAIRKHISCVKGGRFALRCAPAKVVNVILSDIIGDPLDAIASGPPTIDIRIGAPPTRTPAPARTRCASCAALWRGDHAAHPRSALPGDAQGA